MSNIIKKLKCIRFEKLIIYSYINKYMMPFIIGIAGGSCSGKTSVSEFIQSISPTDITIISQDSYYKGLQKGEHAQDINFDDPSSIEWDLLNDNIIKLKNGECIDEPIYDFKSHRRSEHQTRKIYPTKIIIIEGILIFYNKDLLQLLDKKIFIDVDCDVRYRRRIQRDVIERNREIQHIDHQWDTYVKPSHNKYIEDTKNYADVILRNNKQVDKINGNIKINIDILDIYIKSILYK